MNRVLASVVLLGLCLAGCASREFYLQDSEVRWEEKGIQRVEVRVDEGDWHEATLAAQDTTDTWRQWTWPWRATSGQHTIEVRATDADGAVQPEHRVPPFPDGATGWHTVQVSAG